MDKLRRKELADWFSRKILKDRVDDANLHKLSHKPSTEVFCYQGYAINGFRFRTDLDQPRTTVNSGVCVLGEWTTDNSMQVDYYGVIKEVVEVDYEGRKIVLFKCHWFDIDKGIDKGIKHDKKYGLVEVKHTSSLKYYEPFVFAHQADQVYYLPYASGKRGQRWVAMKTRKKENLGVEEIDESYEFYQEEQLDCHILPVTEGQDMNLEYLPRTSEETSDDVVQKIVEEQEEFVADRYGLERLKAICAKLLCAGIDEKTGVTTLSFAARHSCPQLKAFCVEFVASLETLDS